MTSSSDGSGDKNVQSNQNLDRKDNNDKKVQSNANSDRKAYRNIFGNSKE